MGKGGGVRGVFRRDSPRVRKSRGLRAGASLALALALAPAFADPGDAPPEPPHSASEPAAAGPLSDSLNAWPTAAPAAGADSLRPTPSPAASGPEEKRAAPRTPSADSLEDRVRILNAITGSHQEAHPPQWRKRAPYPGAPLLLTLPFADFPYGLRADFDSPSMRQSLMLNAAATQWASQTVAWLWSSADSDFLRNLGTYATLGAFTYYFTYMPLGDAWLHEEWHRAVFSRRGISSHNGIYDFDIGSDAIAVDRVSDADLASLKDRHPADFTRVMEAGGEGEVEAVRLMRRRDFFLGRASAPDRVAWWTSNLTVTAYLWTCSGSDFDQSLRDANDREADPSRRDFTGLDFRAWVHDLRHPDERYADGPRGRTHPSGTGYDRYLMDGDLTRDERNFLKLQAGLSLLNLFSGQHFGWDWLPGRNPWTGQGYLWNFGFTHHLTPFGYAVGGEFLMRQGRSNWVFTAQGMVDAYWVYPCLGMELFRYPLAMGSKPLYLSAALQAWLQPEDQRFRAAAPEPGAYGLLGAALPVGRNLEIFAEADAKTPGWVPGVAYLESVVEGRAGVQFRL